MRASAPSVWSNPRSSTTVSMPFVVSCRAIRPAVNPPPTITTVCFSSFLAMAISCSAEIDDRLRILRARIGLAAKLHHVAGVSRRETGVSDHLPEHLVVVAAVDRIRETRLDEQRIDEVVEPRGE